MIINSKYFTSVDSNKIFFMVFLYTYFIGFDPIRSEYLVGAGVENTSLIPLKEISILLLTLYTAHSIFKHSFFPQAGNVGIFLHLVNIAWCVLSVAWSSNQFESIKKIFLVYSVYYFIAFFIARVGFNSMLLLIEDFLYFCVILSIICCLFIADAVHSYSAIDPELAGAWKGLFGHKNHAGLAAGLLLIIHFFGSKKISILKITIVLAFIYATKAKTIVPFLAISMFFTLLAILINIYYPKVHSSLVSFLFFLFTALILVVVLWSEITLLFNDQSALTGRVAIWDTLYLIIVDNSYIGLSFSSVFDPNNPKILYDYSNDWRQYIYHSHNGYIEVALYTGIIGLFTFVISNILLTIFLLGNFTNKNEKLISFCIVIFIVLYNFLETTFYNENSIGWVMLSIVCINSVLKNNNDSLPQRYT